MKKKIIIMLLLSLCACQQDDLRDIKIKEKNFESNELIEAVTENEVTPTVEKKPTVSTGIVSPQINTRPNEVTIETTQDTSGVDENSVDYYIHKGRIDCDKEETCMEVSLPIQFKYNELISNTFYLEVLSKKEEILGYFIEYVFKENTYETEEECHTVGNNIRDELSDRVLDYNCNGTVLNVITDY